MERWQRFAELAEEGEGFVTRAQAAAIGIPASTFYRHARRTLRKVGANVVSAHGAPQQPRQRLLAAQHGVECGGAAAARWAALWVHGLTPSLPTVVDLVLPGEGWRPRSEKVRVGRSALLSDADVVVVDGILVTAVAWTLLDMAGLVEPAYLRRLVIDARQRRIVTSAEVRDVCERRPRASGVAVLRRILAQLDAEDVDSVFELAVRDLLRTTGLPEPHPRPLLVPTPNGWRQLDIPWPRSWVSIDCDGRAYHDGVASYDAGGVRRTDLAGTDWSIAIATWHRIERSFDAFFGQLEQLFAKSERLLAAGVMAPIELPSSAIRAPALAGGPDRAGNLPTSQAGSRMWGPA